jgi:hypothetical protein
MAANILEVQYKLQYLALEDLESFINQQVTNRSIAFHYTNNQQHPALIQRVQSLITGVLVFIDYVYTMSFKQ